MRKNLSIIAIIIFCQLKGQTTFTWTGSSSGAWLTTTNWNPTGSPTLSTNIALFNNNTQPTNGINMNTLGGAMNLGAFSFTTGASTGRTINNSSGTVPGTVTLLGANINSVPNTIIRNASTGSHTITNGTQNLGISLGNTTDNRIMIDGTGNLLISSSISGASNCPLSIGGSGTGRLDITSTGNTFSGLINVVSNEVRFSTDGSFGAVPGSVVANAITVDGGRLATVNSGTFTLNTNRGIQVGNTAGTSISTPGSGVLTYNGIIANKPSTTGAWAKQGGGTLILGGNSTYSGETAINNGTLQIAVNGALPNTTTISIGQAASTNVGVLNLNGFTQQISGLYTNAASANVASKNTINSTSAATLTINNTTNYTYGNGTGTNSGILTGAITLIKNGSGVQTLGDANTYTGATIINNGELRVIPTGSITTVNLSSSAVSLNGGTLGTSGINSGGVVNFSTLDLEGNASISLAASAHTLNFAASNGVTWSSALGNLDIIGWTGTYTTMPGSTGTNGKIFIGNSASALTAAQLAKIRFYDGSTYYGAILLSTGELVPNGKLSKLESAFCGYTSVSPIEYIWADSLGTPSVNNNDRYIFKLINGASTFTWQTPNGWPVMQFYNFPGLTLNTTYTASVAWSGDGGVTFGAFGPTCTISSPVNGATNISSATCGATLSSFSSPIFADGNGASQYEFQLINSALSYTQTKVNTAANCNLSMFTGITNGATYTISVRAFVMGVWSPYSPTCTITAPNGATTQLSVGSCGSSPASLTSGIFADAVSGATQYEYQLSNSSLSYSSSVVRTAPNFNLSMFTGLQNLTTYTAQVRVFVGGSWGNYGPVCTLTTPAIPTTSLWSGSCGSSPATFISGIFANAVNGATQYEYRLSNNSLSYTSTVVRSGSNFNLSMFAGVQNSTTYTCDVRVFVGGSWGNYGTACTLNSPGIPTTSLSPGSCNTSPASYYTVGLFVNQVAGATQYEYTLYNTANSYTSVITRSASNFNLGMFSPLPAVSTTYSVIVRVNQGSGFGSYGPLCTVTSPGTQAKLGGSAEVEFAQNTNNQSALKVAGGLNDALLDAIVFPNPAKESFKVQLTNYEVNQAVTINVYDALGRLMDSKTEQAEVISNFNLGADYAKGIYNVVVMQGNTIKNFKVVKE